MKPAKLEDELLALMAQGVEAPLPEAEFNRLALAVFAHQFKRNRPYGAFCRLRGRTPDTVTRWEQIPAVPTNAFKAADLTTVPMKQVKVTYLTSGTTRGGETRGRHLLPDTRLYDASLLPNFKAHLLPDRDSIRVLVCGPSAKFFPQSSLGHMNSKVLEEFGAPGSGLFWHDDGPRFPCLAKALEKAEREREPVCILGTAFGFVHFMDWLEEQGKRFQLPPGSRLMDTGGYKGRSREVPKAELYALYTDRLGIPDSHIVNEYGMTELGSQFYDSSLRLKLPGPKSKVQSPKLGLDSRPAAGGGAEDAFTSVAAARLKCSPPWCRVTVVDPETLKPLSDGEIGLLRFFDLANLHTVSAIQTDDLGRIQGDGFEILGRAAGAEPRGCSLAVEELLAAREGE